jgi:DNA-binding NarL/FixJ family response regulator
MIVKNCVDSAHGNRENRSIPPQSFSESYPMSFVNGSSQALETGAPPYTAPPSSGSIRIAIADNNQMNGELLSGALKRRSLDVVGSFIDYSSLRLAVRDRTPDVLLISPDLADGFGSGFKMMRELRANETPTKVVVLLDSWQRERIVEAFWCGALGVFCKSGSIRSLSKCITCVHKGQVWATAQELRLVLEALSYSVPPRLVNAQGIGLLTQREHDVVRCVAEGLSNREVAKRLRISEHTVKNYLLHIFDKLGVSSRVEVVLYASAQRWQGETTGAAWDLVEVEKTAPSAHARYGIPQAPGVSDMPAPRKFPPPPRRVRHRELQTRTRRFSKAGGSSNST